MANVFLQQGDLSVLNTVRLDGNCLKTLKLFKNDHTPAVDDVNADYTEADFSGYASFALGNWNAAFLNPDDKGEIDATAHEFAHNGGATGNTIYGVYVVNNAGNVVYAERFDSPRSMTVNTDKIKYTARVTAVSE
jgi:hypothetical protein